MYIYIYIRVTTRHHLWKAPTDTTKGKGPKAPTATTRNAHNACVSSRGYSDITSRTALGSYGRDMSRGIGPP